METSSSSNLNPNDEIKELLKEADIIISKYAVRDTQLRNSSSCASGTLTKESVNEVKATSSSNDDLQPSTSKNHKISKIRNEIDSFLKEIDSAQLKENNQTEKKTNHLKQTIHSIIVNVDESLNTSATAISHAQNTTNISSAPTTTNVLNLEPNNDDVIFISESTPEVISLITSIKNLKRIRTANEVVEINDSFNESSQPSSLKSIKLGSTSNKNEAPSKRNKSLQNEAILKCAICLQSSFGKIPTSTPCGHIFCFDCIEMALKSRFNCPLCNKKLRKKQLVKLYP